MTDRTWKMSLLKRPIDIINDLYYENRKGAVSVKISKVTLGIFEQEEE
jgi:hypothetical protein